MGYSLLIAVCLSVGLIIADAHFKQLGPVRNVLSTALTPVRWLSAAPSNLVSGIQHLFTSRLELENELGLMQSKMLLLERKSQKLASVTAELNHLRELLKATRIVDEGVVVAELLGVSPDPDDQYIMINKGRSHGVYLGQAVLDSQGLMGQVVEVSEYASRVLLISDIRHAVPVQVNRNGVRAIAYGVGSLSYLELGNVPETADIQVGDLLVSSGLGGRFPRGYPVATVNAVEHHPGQPFARVKVVPEAQLNRSRLLLLVFKEVEQQATPITPPPALSAASPATAPTTTLAPAPAPTTPPAAKPATPVTAPATKPVTNPTTKPTTKPATKPKSAETGSR